MSFQKIVLAILFVMVGNTYSNTDDRCFSVSSSKEKWQKFAQIYAASLLPSVALGSACGAACHFFDVHGPFPVMINWIVCLGIRKASAQSIKKSLADCCIEYDETFFDNAVWISSWIAYLTRCKLATQTINVLVENEA